MFWKPPVFALFGIFAALPSIASAQTLTPPKVITSSPTGVNMIDGTYTTSVDDLSIGSLTLQRSYLGGQETSNHYFGPNWTHNFDIYMKYRAASLNHEATTTMVIGREKFVYYGPPQSAVPQSDETDTSFQVISSNYVFTNRYGVVYTIFSGSGNVNIRYPSGRTIDIVRVNNLPKLITSNDGSAILFDYTGSSISAACAFNLSQTYVSTASTCASAALKTTYQYTSGNLTGATDVMGNQASYSYGSGGLACLTDPGTPTCKITNYYAAGHANIDHQVLADGTTWYFSCTCSGSGGRDDGIDSSPDDTSSWLDPAGKSVSFDYHAYVLNQITDERGLSHQPTYFGRYLTTIKSPEGNITTFLSPDGRFPAYQFTAKPGSGLTDIVQGAQTFPTNPCSNLVTCYLPLTIADAKGNITNYVYDQTHGGVLSEMQPAPTSGAARPLKLYTYVQKSAYVKNFGGSLVSTGVPIWVISTMIQCQTVAGSSTAACDTAAGAPRLQTTYQYSSAVTANNLLARGVEVKDLVTSATRLTCYTYDPIGRKISQTSPRGNASISVCP